MKNVKTTEPISRGSLFCFSLSATSKHFSCRKTIIKTIKKIKFRTSRRLFIFIKWMDKQKKKRTQIFYVKKHKFLLFFCKLSLHTPQVSILHRD